MKIQFDKSKAALSGLCGNSAFLMGLESRCKAKISLEPITQNRRGVLVIAVKLSWCK